MKHLLVFLSITICFHLLTFSVNASEIQIISWNDKKSAAETIFETALKKVLPDVKVSYVFANRDKGKLATGIRNTDYSKIDLVISGGTTTTKLVKTYLMSKKPLMFHMVSSPVLSKIVDSMEKPGHNITGVSSIIDLKTQLDILTKLKKIKSLGVMFDPREKQNPVILSKIKEFSKSAGIEIKSLRVIPDAGNFEQLMNEALAKSANLDAIYIIPNASYALNMKNIADKFSNKTLIMAYGQEFAKHGVSVAIDSDPRGMIKSAIETTIKILKGTPTDQIPVSSIKKEDMFLAVNKSKTDQEVLNNLNILGIKIRMVE